MAGPAFLCAKIMFDHISDQYATFILLICFAEFCMLKNHLRLHFLPFQINTQLFVLEMLQNNSGKNL